MDLSANRLPSRLFVALKYYSDSEAYVITPDSALHQSWKNQHNIIPEGKHLLRVTVGGDGAGPEIFDMPLVVDGKDHGIMIDASRYLPRLGKYLEE